MGSGSRVMEKGYYIDIVTTISYRENVELPLENDAIGRIARGCPLAFVDFDIMPLPRHHGNLVVAVNLYAVPRKICSCETLTLSEIVRFFR